jgi:hypothetical protein
VNSLVHVGPKSTSMEELSGNFYLVTELSVWKVVFAFIITENNV